MRSVVPAPTSTACQKIAWDCIFLPLLDCRIDAYFSPLSLAPIWGDDGSETRPQVSCISLKGRLHAVVAQYFRGTSRPSPFVSARKENPSTRAGGNLRRLRRVGIAHAADC